MKKHGMNLAVTAAILILTICGCKDGKQDITSPYKSDMTDISTTVFPSVTSTADTVSAAASSVSAADAPEPVPDERYSAIADTAQALIGTPFLYGGASPSGFDNSGLIYYVLRENGYIGCPRTISEQIEWGSSAGYDELKAGDIAYFSNEPNGEAAFGGIYIGKGIMVYAPSPDKRVTCADITEEYWKSRFVTALSL